uniref:NADH dehydrogenase subunit 6 n=1 Tax=Sminthurus viridis TaxID=109609 RepID=B2BS96_SMIVR|nr:NADH dehydrogenase subunit 6 [Sminthurus viridis]ABS82051.1 NADH dehydrogenase subunit 6 [Sminthurus viridis]
MNFLMKLMVLFSSFMSFLIMKTNNPMMFTVVILLQALFLCMMICFSMNTSWFSYILFLIFLGGLMIIFSYVCSLASNESINIQIQPVSISSMALVSTLILLNGSEINLSMLNDSVQTIFKMMSKLMVTPSIVSMFYLLITLIVIVKISFKKMGSLRSSKKYDNSKK